MSPRHTQDPLTLPLGSFAAVPVWEDKDLLDASRLPQFALYVGYQLAPQKLIDQAKATGVKLAYFDVQPAQPPERASNILYIDPAWPVADGCVTVPGCDVPVLPVSGWSRPRFTGPWPPKAANSRRNVVRQLSARP